VGWLAGRFGLVAAAIVVAATLAAATRLAPQAGAPAAVTLGATTFANLGLVGVGRLPASLIDAFGDSFGSVSGLQITDWTRVGDGGYTGTFNILPDRGYNGTSFYADYRARIHQVRFSFAPYDQAAPIGGDTVAEKLDSQRQVTFTLPITSLRLKYYDPVRRVESSPTGLDPGSGVGALFGHRVPYVTSYTGPATAAEGAPSETFRKVDTLAIDVEALALRPDGSGYVGDEYGPFVYHFDRAKMITGVIVPPPAFLPHMPADTLNFASTSAPLNGRRNNQGFEGVALSPDGRRLFLLLQSALVQDGDPTAHNQRARHTRLLVYDVSAAPTPAAPVAEYALTLPVFAARGRGGAPDRTAAQSEIVALDDTRLLILARDANGLGSPSDNPSVFKRVLLADLRVGAPTNFARDAARNAEGGRITTSAGVLDPAITPVQWVEAVDLLDAAQLARFNVLLDTGADPVSPLTLSEKWEGLSLVPALDSARPNDYFLFVANDNDFLTSDGRTRGPGGPTRYNAFAGYPSSRVPSAVPGAGIPGHGNDTMFLVYRLTIVPRPMR
jgi:hypothetical protein